MATDVNGVELKFGLQIQVEIQNPPVPSAQMVSVTADVRAKAPVGTIADTVNVGILFTGLPRANVTPTLTSGDPIGPSIDTYIAEFVHQMYVNDGPAFPHTITRTNQTISYLGFNAYQVDAFVELFDDSSNPALRIEVTRVGSELKVRIPIHLRIYNIVKLIGLAPTLLSPMGVEARLVITAPFTADPSTGTYRAQLPAAMVTVEGLTAASENEGANYNSNKALLGSTLDTMLISQLTLEGQNMVQKMQPIQIDVPTVAEIEAGIGDVFHQQLVEQGSLAVWSPQTNGAAPVDVNNVTPKALADALAIAINAGGGADANALDNFVPAGLQLAIAIDGGKVLSIIDETIHRPESEGGFGPDFPPKHFTNVNDHEADLTRLNVSLINGAIHMEGDVTVIDAVLGSIDVDASFEVDVGLHWEDNADGTQRMVSDPGEPDVDLSLLAWIVSFLIGFITLGLVGGVIAIVVLIIVESIATRIGGTLVRDNVTNQVTGIGAWPSQLHRIGTVQARFENPIFIAPDGILFAG
jgi:hypothetical protein